VDLHHQVSTHAGRTKTGLRLWDGGLLRGATQLGFPQVGPRNVRTSRLGAKGSLPRYHPSGEPPLYRYGSLLTDTVDPLTGANRLSILGLTTRWDSRSEAHSPLCARPDFHLPPALWTAGARVLFPLIAVGLSSQLLYYIRPELSRRNNTACLYLQSVAGPFHSSSIPLASPTKSLHSQHPSSYAY